MTIFADKLATLASTVRMGLSGPVEAVASALREGADRPAVAIGSGGSAIMAEYFARCRSTLGLGVTLVQSPMEFVLAANSWSDFDVWLFSAGAQNPDVSGALTAAVGSSAAKIWLLTVNAEGSMAVAAAQHDRVRVIVAPVAERKDGFLATHSLVAMVACMLVASDHVAKRSTGSSALIRYAHEVDRIVARAGTSVAGFRKGDTVFLLHDPQCRTLATLIETSLWETGIAPIQRTDFRNFAHGRHVWAARYPNSMFVLAVTAAVSRNIWERIRVELPKTVRTAHIDIGQAGRFNTAVSVVDGLMAILLLGEAAGIDPGRPGRGEFADAIYGDTSLAELAAKLTPALRHKPEAVQVHDDPSCPAVSAEVARDDWLCAISGARIGAIVLDYDGTVVATEARLGPPSPGLVTELTRLADAGLKIAFATGRGGSAGKALREALPEWLHSVVTVGYYNGGHIRPLSVDIEVDPPAANPDLTAFADWIEEQALLKPGVSIKRGGIQITIWHSDVLTPTTFLQSLARFPAIAEGRIKRLSSHHSFDLLPVESSKASVSAALRHVITQGTEVLAIGDSGEPDGNDSELLAAFPSVSVDGVCGHLGGSWSLFGGSLSGPAALLRILRALRVENGHARLDLDLLGTGLA
jgi:hypothetical protein